jgi:aminopeptidase YwaD
VNDRRAPRPTLRDVGYFLRGRVNRGVSLVLNGRPRPPAPTSPLEDVLARARQPEGRTPPALVALLEGRDSAGRQAAVARYLEARGVPVTRQRFATFEGRGENYAVELGGGDRILVLIAHHDAVPGSPGANDNAASVALLLELMEHLAAAPPSRLRVRLLFTAAEELGYLGARMYVRETSLAGIVGVLSLELCGIGDTLALWDAADPTPFRSAVGAAMDGVGRRADDDYHVVGRIPVFGSDHRAFAAAGVPAYGLTMVPGAEAQALRDFIFRPSWAGVRHAVRRPRPFDTYHTRRDSGPTLEPAALAAVARALDAIVAELG